MMTNPNLRLFVQRGKGRKSTFEHKGTFKECADRLAEIKRDDKSITKAQIVNEIGTSIMNYTF